MKAEELERGMVAVIDGVPRELLNVVVGAIPPVVHVYYHNDEGVRVSKEYNVGDEVEVVTPE